MALMMADSGKRTVLVDADFSGANIHHVFDLSASTGGMMAFLRASYANINHYLESTPVPRLSILSGPRGEITGANLSYAQKHKLLKTLKTIDADVVILDIGAGTAYNQLDAFLAASVGLVVITPEPHAIMDGYNFIKLSLMRQLYRTFRDDKEISLMLKAHRSVEIGNEGPTSFETIAKRVQTTGNGLYDRWQSIINEFRPVLIINEYFDGELERCYALPIAAWELLGVKMDTVHLVRLDDDLRNDFIHHRWQRLREGTIPAAADIHRMVASVLDGDTRPGVRFDPVPDKKKVHEDTVICSISCARWGDCRFQRGGYPCRLNMVGFLNQTRMQSTE
jgi:flagellar biosynthesis protein FlhG